MAMNSIYQGALLEHNSNPVCRHELEDATHSHDGVNSSCGDELTLSLSLTADNVIEKAAFLGNGCAISQASADIMAELITGKPLAEAVALSEDFMAMVRGEELTAEQKQALGKAADLEGISEMPARQKCAELGWRTLKEIANDLEGSAL